MSSRRSGSSAELAALRHVRDPSVVDLGDADAPRGGSDLVSFVVPTKDSAATVEACLASIRAQSDASIELIVVDNASKDGTAAIARRQADRVISAGPERSAQRNIGAAAARGDYLVFVDSDMVVPVDLAASVIDAFRARRELAALVIPERSAGSGFWARCRSLEKSLYEGDRSVEAARAFRRAAFERAGGFDEALFAGEDWDLTDRVDPDGHATGRVAPVVTHDEGRLRLRDDLRKKLYYGRSLRRYVVKDRGAAARRVLRPALIRGLPTLARRPVSALGLAVMKVLELAAVLVGVVLGAGAGDAARRRRGNGVLALTYLVPAVLGGMATQTWFRAGTFVAGGDVAPFIRTNLSAEGSSLWSHSLTGAGSPSFQTVARVPELAVIAATRSLGGSNELAQRIFFTVLVAASILAVVFFALAFVSPGRGAAFAGLLGMFNPYVLQHLPNPLTLWSIAVMAAAGGLVIRAAKGQRPSVVALVCVSLAGGYLSLNPPLLAVAAAWVVVLSLAASVLAGEGGTHRALTFLASALPWVVLANLWWAVPWGLTMRSARSGIGLAVQTDVRAWAWTQARSSIPNVLTVSGQWGWSHPEYFPYAASLDRGAWSVLKFGTPAVAFLAPWFAPPRIRRACWALVAVVLLLAFVAKGLHPPFTAANLFLYDHIPGMWLLREPLSKLGPAIVLCYVALTAVALEAVHRFGSRTSAMDRATRGIVAAIAIGAIAYPMPLWTGEVVPDERPLLPGEHVSIPEGWTDLARVVNASPLRGKALVLPLDDYYQMPTTWGYYGADTIPRSLLHRPTIQPLPDGYYGDLPGYAALVRALETALEQRDTEAVPRLLRALNVSYVIVRSDIDQQFPRRPMPDPAPLEATLAATPGIREVGDFDVARLFSMPSGAQTVEATDGVILDRELTVEGLPLVIASVDHAPVAGEAIAGAAVGSAGTVDPLRPVGAAPSDSAGAIIAARPVEPQPYRTATRETRRARSLVLRPMSVVRFRSQLLTPPRPSAIPLRRRGAVAAVGVGASIVPLSRHGATIGVSGVQRVTAYTGVEAPLGGTQPTTVGDCNAYNDRSSRETGIGVEPLPATDGLRLRARTHSACVAMRVRGGTAAAPYLVRLEYRTLAGEPARLCLLQRGPGTCAPLPALQPSSSWASYSAAVTPDPGTTRLTLILYADGGRDPGETIAEYRRPSVSVLRPIGSRVVEAVPPAPDTVADSTGGPLSLPIPASSARFATSFSRVNDCNAFDRRPATDVGIDARPLPSSDGLGVRLRADDHSACVNTPVLGFAPGSSYLLQLQYRSVSGRAPRLCLWQEGPDRCASMPPLDSSEAWHTLRTLIDPLPGTQALRLFLYADGGGSATTVTEYRNVVIRSAPAFGAVVLDPPGRRTSSPDVTWTERTPSDYHAHLPALERPTLLILRESYSSGWVLDGISPERVAAHVTVDGYANGWWIRPGPEADIGIVYAPDDHTRLAMIASGASLLLLFLGVIVLRYRARSRRGPIQ